MPTISFTVRSLDALEPPTSGQVDYWDPSVPGFGLRISNTGLKTWIAYYRINGRKRRYKIETYTRMPLSDARTRAKQIFAEVAKGIDPAAVKQSERKAETFGDLAHLYLELHAKENKKSWKEDERILNKEVLPQWGTSKASAISRRDVIHLLDLTVKRGAKVHANRVLALVRKIFNFGISRDIVVMNPCQAVTRPTKEHARDRVLTADEIRSFWNALESEDMDIQGIFKLYLLTSQRGAEVRSIAKSEIDMETGWWTIPDTKTKNGLQHRVFLSVQAQEIVRAQKARHPDSPWLFPTSRANRETTKTPHINNIQKAIQRLQLKTKIEFVGHDLRRTAASNMTGMGIPRLVVSKILNHVETGVTKVYDRHSYDAEKREALQRWADHLFEILSGSTEAKVIQMAKAV